jgi:hypothetical protein
MLDDFDASLQPQMSEFQSKLHGIPTSCAGSSGASITGLRNLFSASAEFHDAAPWEVFYSQTPVQVAVPGGGMVFVLVTTDLFL